MHWKKSSFLKYMPTSTRWSVRHFYHHHHHHLIFQSTHVTTSTSHKSNITGTTKQRETALTVALKPEKQDTRVVFFEGLGSSGQLWAGLGCSKSFSFCFRNESLAFFNRSGKARVDPIAFQIENCIKPVQRGKWLTSHHVSQSNTLFTNDSVWLFTTDYGIM